MTEKEPSVAQLRAKRKKKVKQEQEKQAIPREMALGVLGVETTINDAIKELKKVGKQERELSKQQFEEQRIIIEESTKQQQQEFAKQITAFNQMQTSLNKLIVRSEKVADDIDKRAKAPITSEQKLEIKQVATWQDIVKTITIVILSMTVLWLLIIVLTD